jgi:hypothetical protein
MRTLSGGLVELRRTGCDRAHSLFADRFGDGGELLTSEQATRTAILGQLEALTGCSEDDSSSSRSRATAASYTSWSPTTPRS